MSFPTASICLVLALLLSASPAIRAAEIKVLGAIGFQPVMSEATPRFERGTGHRVEIVNGTIGQLLKRVEGGESADVILLPRQGFDGLVKGGKVAEGSIAVLARSSMGIAVRSGAQKPDIASAESLKRALLAARSVVLADPTIGGISSEHFTRVFERLGIAEEMKRKTAYSKIGSGATFASEVAAGEIELALNQLQVMAPLPGLDIVGPIPAEFQLTTTFAAAVTAGARDPAASQSLVDFLRTPESAAVIKAKGMEPAGR